MSEAAYCLECNRNVKPTPAGRCPRCDRQLAKSNPSIDDSKTFDNVHEWAASLHAAIDVKAQADGRDDD